MIITQPIYDGSFIHQRFAYKYYRENVSPSGNIVVFRSPMSVTDNLIDLEDSLNKDCIYSDDAINFCWEIPNLCPIGAVAFQRYFNTNIASILGNLIGKTIKMKGDDIMVNDPFISHNGKEVTTGKASVSITYSKDNVAIGHTGININAGTRAPSFAYSTKLSDAYINLFIQTVSNFFYDTTKDMFVASSKIIV